MDLTVTKTNVVVALLFLIGFGLYLGSQDAGAQTPAKLWRIEHYDDAEMNVRCYVLIARSEIAYTDAIRSSANHIQCVAYDPPEFP